MCVTDHWMDPHSPRHTHHTLVWKGKPSGSLQCLFQRYKKESHHTECMKISIFKRIFQSEIETNHDLIATYRHHISTTMNQSNVSQFLRSYKSRGALEVERPIPGGNINVRTLKWVQLLTFTGELRQVLQMNWSVTVAVSSVDPNAVYLHM